MKEYSDQMTKRPWHTPTMEELVTGAEAAGVTPDGDGEGTKMAGATENMQTNMGGPS